MKNKLIYIPAIILFIALAIFIASLIINVNTEEEVILPLQPASRYCHQEECFGSKETFEDYVKYLEENENNIEEEEDEPISYRFKPPHEYYYKECEPFDASTGRNATTTNTICGNVYCRYEDCPSGASLFHSFTREQVY